MILNKLKPFLFLILILIVQSCGKDKMASTSQSSSGGALTYSGGGVCKMANGGSFSGCCSSHSGAKNCGTGLYLFSSSNNLVCNDGTLSPTCTGSN